VQWLNRTSLSLVLFIVVMRGAGAKREDRWSSLPSKCAVTYAPPIPMVQAQPSCPATFYHPFPRNNTANQYYTTNITWRRTYLLLRTLVPSLFQNIPAPCEQRGALKWHDWSSYHVLTVPLRPPLVTLQSLQLSKSLKSSPSRPTTGLLHSPQRIY
jgi:hypothetical protein